ncbi:MFS transporter [Vibrio bivalvicida]|uniref:MFS transporter n=1 Tax=Vibrio bivalvicida TaxID=1276888 RepID=A0ABV4MPC4_9VIBR
MRSVNRIIWFGTLFASSRMLIGAISAVYMLNHGLSLTEVGIVKTIQAASIFVLDIPLAYSADKFSRKLSVVLSALFGSIWLWLMSIGDSLTTFGVAEFFNAVSLSLIGGAFFAYLVDCSREEKSNTPIKDILARYNKYQFFGVAVSGFVGAIIFGDNNPAVWQIAASLCLLLTVTGIFFLPKDNTTNNHSTSKKSSLKSDFQKIQSHLYLNRVPLGSAMLAILAISVFYQVLIQYWQPFSTSGLDFNTDLPLVYAFTFFVIQILQSLSSGFIERIKNESVVLHIGSSLAFISAILVLGGVRLSGYLIVLGVITMYCSILFLKTYWLSYFHEMIENDYRGTYDAILSTLTRFFLFFMMPLVGAIVEAFGWNSFVYILLLVVFSLNTIFLTFNKNFLDKEKVDDF